MGFMQKCGKFNPLLQRGINLFKFQDFFVLNEKKYHQIRFYMKRWFLVMIGRSLINIDQ